MLSSREADHERPLRGPHDEVRFVLTVGARR
jgi:hypothetical protein